MPQKDTRISVFGDGGWGTALALLFAEKGMRVFLWGAFPDYVSKVSRTRENEKFLPGFKIPENVQLGSELREACEFADVWVWAVPSQHLRGVLRRVPRGWTKGKLFVLMGKGIETKTGKVMSQVLKETLGTVRFCVVSGPNIAREVATKTPSAASAASKNRKDASRVRELLSAPHFRVFESRDVLGVELGGSLKNVIAICSGIVEGLGLGSNTRAFLFARGVAEMARLGRSMGAQKETFMGLSGLGDLATTCLSPHSRNRSLGFEIGKGKKLDQLLSETEMVVEGVDTARSAYKLAKKHRVPMPITEAVYKILFEKKKPEEAVNALLSQKQRRETE